LPPQAASLPLSSAATSEFKLENFEVAVQAFRKACRADSEDALRLWALANCCDAMRRPKIAERFLRKGLELNGLKGRDRAAFRVNLGNALFDQKRFLEAAAAYLPICERRDETGRKARSNFKRASEMASK
jgi:tetratricopeptide (TPR) repeat protein